MNPYAYVLEATKNGESLLSLCCGIGYEFININAGHITAVDIVPQYLAEVWKRCQRAVLVESDAATYIKKAKSHSVDVISCIDGLEHLSKKDGRIVLKECKRVAIKEVLIFTQEGYVENEPHDAWDIPGADEYQTHKSGWSIAEIEKLGYKLIKRVRVISQHGEPFYAVMYRYAK